MTLPATGNLTRSQIKAEFGLGTAAVWPGDYLGLGGAPTARPLKWSDFHGLSSVSGASFLPAAGNTYNSYDSGSTGDYQVVTCNIAVVWNWVKVSGPASLSSTVANGGTATSIQFDLPYPGLSDKTATINLSCTVGGTTYSWVLVLHASATGGTGTCVSSNSFMLMADGNEKQAGDVRVGDWVFTFHEHTLEPMAARVSAISFHVDQVYARNDWPDATGRHRFLRTAPNWLLKLLPSKLRWFQAKSLGKKKNETVVAKTTVNGAHTYLARHPNSDKWRVCHNVKA